MRSFTFFGEQLRFRTRYYGITRYQARETKAGGGFTVVLNMTALISKSSYPPFWHRRYLSRIHTLVHREPNTKFSIDDSSPTINHTQS